MNSKRIFIFALLQLAISAGLLSQADKGADEKLVDSAEQIPANLNPLNSIRKLRGPNFGLPRFTTKQLKRLQKRYQRMGAQTPQLLSVDNRNFYRPNSVSGARPQQYGHQRMGRSASAGMQRFPNPSPHQRAPQRYSASAPSEFNYLNRRRLIDDFDYDDFDVDIDIDDEMMQAAGEQEQFLGMGDRGFDVDSVDAYMDPYDYYEDDMLGYDGPLLGQGARGKSTTIIIIVVAGVVGLLLLIIVIYCVIRKRSDTYGGGGDWA